MSTLVFDAVIIGGGLMGTNIAHALAQAGRKVAVVERSTSGSGTSQNSFAWINATAKVSNRTYFNLNAAGCESYRSLAKRWGDKRIGLHRTGMVETVLCADETAKNALQTRAARLREFGYPVQTLSDSDLRAMEPHINFAGPTEGLYAFADAWLDIPTFVAFLNDRIRELHGQVFENCEALELMFDDEGTVVGVNTSTGEMHCRDVILATGPDTARALTQLTGYEAFESRFPLQRVPGLLVTTPSDAAYHPLQRVLYAAGAADLHIRPTPDGGLLLGSDVTDGLVSEDSSPDEIRQAAIRLLMMSCEILPDLTSDIEQCRIGIGIRAVPSDGQSIVGPMPGSKGLTVVVTHSGVTLGLVVGQLVSDWITTGVAPETLKPFSLDRFQGFV